MENVLMRECPDKIRRADNSNLYKSTAPVTKTAAYTMTAEDSGKLFNHTGAAGSVTFTFPNTLPIGWWCEIHHDANQEIVLACSSATLNGAATLTSDNTQDPQATARVRKIASGIFKVTLDGTWS